MTPAAAPAAAAPAPVRRAHVPELDGVRGLAIAGVMALHFVNNLVVPTNAVERAAVRVTNYGLWGVDLFFVLSGFLITGILVDSRGRDGYLVNFLARRALRIFPLYYGVLIVLTVLVPVSVLGAIDPALVDARARWPWLWTYLTNVYLAPDTSFSIPYVSHFWSLAVEEHFYLVWPFLIRALPVARAMQACLALGAIALGLRVGFSVVAPDRLYDDVLTPCRIDALCAGAWCALAARHGAGLPRRPTMAAAALAASAVVALTLCHVVWPGTAWLVLPVRTSAVAVTFGTLIYGIVHFDGLGRLKALLRLGALRTTGRYSYGLYVFHAIVAYGMHRAGAVQAFEGLTPFHTLDMVMMAAAGTAVSYVVAVASYHGFEQPFLSLKSHFADGPRPLAAG